MLNIKKYLSLALVGLVIGSGLLYAQAGRIERGRNWTGTVAGGTLTLTGNLTPTANGTQNLGSASFAWNALHVYSPSIYGNASILNVSNYKNVPTAGWGDIGLYGYGDVAAATNVGTASIATYTVGAADGTFEVGCNIRVTTSTTHSFSCDVTYTDEGNTARTMVLPSSSIATAGSFVTTGLITNVTGVGPYSSPVMTIRAKAATAITVRTSAGGTFTTVVYNARGAIKQIG